MEKLNSLAARHKSGIFALRILEIKEDGRAVYQGITLPEFVPEDGAEIY